MSALVAFASGNVRPFISTASTSKKRILPPLRSISGSDFWAVAISPDGTLLAGGYSGVPYLHVRNIVTGEILTPLATGIISATPSSVAFSPDGALLAVGQGSGAAPHVRIFNTTGWGQAVSLTTGDVTRLAFSPNGSLLAVVVAATLLVYRTSDWSAVTVPGAGVGATYDMAFSPDGAYIAVVHTTTPLLTVFRTSDWSKVTLTSGIGGHWSYAVAFSPDSALLAVSHNAAPYVTLYKTSDWTKATTPAGVTSAVATNGGRMRFLTSRLLLASHTAISGRHMTCYDVVSGAAMHEYSDLYHHNGVCRDIAVYTAPPLTVRGSVRDVDNLPAARAVRVFERSTGDLCAATVSDGITGDYAANVFEGDVDYDVQFMTAAGEPLNDLFFARVRAGAP